MRRALTGAGILAAVLAAVLAVLAGPAGATSAGGGAELPSIAFKRWCLTIARCTYEVHDAGLETRKLARGSATWVGVDEELNATQRRQAGGPVDYLPVMLGAVAVVVNVRGIEGHQMRLSGGALGGIFAGTITNWSDRRIRRQNRRHPLGRSQTITLCVPRYDSGTSFDMSGYLAKVSGPFRARVGSASLAPRWQAKRIIRVADVSKIGACVESREGAIGFLDLGDALRQNHVRDIIAVGGPQRVTYGIGSNKNTVTKLVYQHPTTEGMIRAGHVRGRLLGKRLIFNPANTKARGAYPITVGVWVAYRSDRRMSTATRASLTAMLSRSGQRQLAGLGFAALPRNIVVPARKALAKAR